MTWRLLVPHLRPHQSLQATTRVFRIGRSLSRLSRSFHTIWLRLLAPVHGNICIYLWYIYFYIFWKTKISALNSRMIEQQWMINLRQASSRAMTFCSRININFSFFSCFLKVSLFLSNTNFKTDKTYIRLGILGKVLSKSTPPPPPPNLDNLYYFFWTPS